MTPRDRISFAREILETCGVPDTSRRVTLEQELAKIDEDTLILLRDMVVDAKR